MQIQFSVRNLIIPDKAEWRLALVGEGPELGHWGSAGFLALARDECCLSDGSSTFSGRINCDAAPQVCQVANIPVRLVLFDGGSFQISAVDTQHYSPRMALLQTNGETSDQRCRVFNVDGSDALMSPVGRSLRWLKPSLVSRRPAAAVVLDFYFIDPSGPLPPKSNQTDGDDGHCAPVIQSLSFSARRHKMDWLARHEQLKALRHGHRGSDAAELAAPDIRQAVVEPLQVINPISHPALNGSDGSLLQRTTTHWQVTLSLFDMLDHALLVHLGPQPSSDQDGGQGTHPAATHVVITPYLIERDSYRGVFAVPVAGFPSLDVVYCRYTIVSPLVHQLNNLKFVRSADCWEKLSLRTFVGHRGLGTTYTGLRSAWRTKLAENSIEAFNAAYARGCECVEFDVMLTKDRVPVVFHDTMLQLHSKGRALTSMHHATAPSSPVLEWIQRARDFAPDSGNFEPVPVGVHQLTLRQLKQVVVEVLAQQPPPTLKNLLRKHWVTLLAVGAARRQQHIDVMGELNATDAMSSTRPPPPHPSSSPTHRQTPSTASTPMRSLHQQCSATSPSAASSRSPSSAKSSSVVDSFRVISNDLPSLHELFSRTPSSLRFDFEVKFPLQPKYDRNLFLQRDHFELNSYVDTILEAVLTELEEQPEREIVFCSFEPDVCIALMMKQARFHVLFLADGEESEDYRDYRCFYHEGSVQFASSNGLAGISINAKTLLPPERGDGSVAALAAINDTTRRYCEMIVRQAHHLGLKVWTWGRENSDHAFAELQRDGAGVDGVITDNVPMAAAHQYRPPVGGALPHGNVPLPLLDPAALSSS